MISYYFNYMSSGIGYDNKYGIVNTQPFQYLKITESILKSHEFTK